jgi:hypothetical protein
MANIIQIINLKRFKLEILTKDICFICVAIDRENHIFFVSLLNITLEFKYKKKRKLQNTYK